MAGNGRGNSHSNNNPGTSFVGKFFDKVTDTVKTLWPPNAPENRHDVQLLQLGLGEISLCNYCYRPLLSTYDGCTGCMEFKVFPGYCNLPGCSKLCYFDEHTRRVHGFCGKTHAMEYSSRIQQHRHSSQSHGHSSQSHGHSSQSHGHSSQSHGHSSQSHGESHVSHGHTQWQSNHPNYSVNHGYSTRSHNGPILFYNRDEPYYEFTNFYEGQPIVVDDVQWRTSEHYFQAQKFVGTPYVEWIRHLERPREAFDLSRDPSVSRWRRSDWEQVKIGVMHKVLLAKFTQNEYLRRQLLFTGNRQLVEHTHRDSFWGDGGDGSGHNHLGKLLMIVRDELRGKLNVGTSVDKNQTGKNLSTQSRVGNTTTERRMRTDSVEVPTPAPDNSKPEGTQNMSLGKAPEETEPGKDQKAVNDSTTVEKKGDIRPNDSSVNNSTTHASEEGMDTDPYPPSPSSPPQLKTECSQFNVVGQEQEMMQIDGQQGEPPNTVKPDGSSNGVNNEHPDVQHNEIGTG